MCIRDSISALFLDVLANTNTVTDLEHAVTTQVDALTTKVDFIETEMEDAQGDIITQTFGLQEANNRISSNLVKLTEGPINLDGGANQHLILDPNNDEPGITIKCNKDANIPYIKCQNQAGDSKFQVLDDGTVLTHAVFDNNHQNLPDNLATAIATGNDSVYIGQAKISYSDSAGYKFYKLKDNTVPTVLQSAPYSLTKSHIDSRKNNKT